MTIARALVWNGKDFRVADFVAPDPRDRSLLLKVDAVGICGTDRKILSGHLSTPDPIILGHEIVGTVVGIGAGYSPQLQLSVDDRVMVGAAVSCLECVECLAGSPCVRKRNLGLSIPCDEAPFLNGGFATHVVLNVGSRVYRMPREMPLALASFASVLANGLEWIQMLGNLRPGERCLIIGAGAQALACAVAAAECSPARLVVAGLQWDQDRLAFVEALTGAETVIVSSDTSSATSRLGDGRFDLVLEASGSQAGFDLAQKAVRSGGRIVQAGLPAEGARTQVDLGRLVWGQNLLQGVLAKSPESMLRAVEMSSLPRWAGLERATTFRPMTTAYETILGSDLSLAPNAEIFRFGLLPDLV